MEATRLIPLHIKIVDVPTASIPVAESMIPNNLGIAIHARKLLDFEKLVR